MQNFRATGVSRLLVLLILSLFTFVSACDSDPAADPENVPADHTVRNGGALHKPGFSNPESASSGCTSCHGADLRGGNATINGVQVSTPSCFACHGQKWR